MELTILGSGGCMIIPKSLCRCRVCREAREKGVPYARSGPSAYLHDINLLIDTPAEIAAQLNRSRINCIDYLIFTHLDPDHIEGFRVVEQIALDFRTWRAYPQKGVCLLLPEGMAAPLGDIRSQYGSLIDFYVESGFLTLRPFKNHVQIGDVRITAVPVDRGPQISFIYVFEGADRRVVYAPCDIRPFPEDRSEVRDANLLVIQPGIFESGLKHGFCYPSGHISRTTLYTFDQTLDLASRLGVKKVLFVHMEEYWNRSYDDYLALEPEGGYFRFAHDGMRAVI
ncbi:MBL fold metallo-hydrolase [Chloroflexota bacterium]